MILTLSLIYVLCSIGMYGIYRHETEGGVKAAATIGATWPLIFLAIFFVGWVALIRGEGFGILEGRND